jgi:hypothetical protein
MKNERLKLIPLLQEIINEIGDFNNIKPFKFDKNLEFDIPFNNKIYKGKVEITLITDSFILNGLYQSKYDPIITTQINQYYNISYTIDGGDIQSIRSELGLLTRILYTVILILQKELSKYPKNSLFFIAAEEKQADKTQKMDYYWEIMIKNVPNSLKKGEIYFSNNKIGYYIIN